MEEHKVEYYDNGNKHYEGWGWYKDGEFHRLDGPAFISYYDNGNKSYEWWYLHNQEYTESAYNDIIELCKTIITRDAAIMNIKHPSEYIRMRCQEILND
jgi:hypothetical protein